MRAFIVLVFLMLVTKVSFAKEQKRKPSSSESNILIIDDSCYYRNDESKRERLITRLDQKILEGFRLVGVTKLTGNTADSSTCAYYFTR